MGNNYGISIIILCLYFAFTAGLLRAPLMLWEESEVKVKTGTDLVIARFDFKSPCSDALTEERVLKEKRDMYIEICEKRFQKSVVDKLMALCPRRSSSKFLMRRKKREILTLGAVTGIFTFVTSLTAAGFGISNHYRVGVLEDSVSEIRSVLNYVQNNTIVTRDHLIKTEETLNKTVETLKEVSDRQTELFNKFHSQVDVSLELSKYFERMSKLIDEQIKLWSKNKLSIEFFNAMGNPLGSNYSLENAMPIECYSPEPNVVMFITSVPVISLTSTILDAKPFQLIKRSNETDKVCELTYQGPSHLIVEKVDNTTCVISIKDKISDKLILYPYDLPCKPHPDDNDESLFALSTCYPISEINWSKYWKIIKIPMFSYIYNPGGNITLGGNTDDCPDNPFIMSDTIKFNLNGEKGYTNSIRNVVVFHKYEIDWTSTMDFYFDPYKDYKNVYIDPTKLGQIEAKYLAVNGSTSNYWLYSIIGGCVFLFVVVVILKVCKYAVKHAGTRINITGRETDSEIEKLQETLKRMKK